MKSLVTLILIFIVSAINAQYNYNEEINNKKAPTYVVEDLNLPKIKSGKKPKNIILLIGDGMGVAHVHAGMTVNKGKLYLQYFKNMGLLKTHSADNYITDSAAGGTALASGKKTNNKMIGMTPDSTHIKTILELAEELGKSTGMVSTSSITHATPASFIAHQTSRNMYEAIAADFLKTDIDVFIGGGKNNFTARKDGRNLLVELEEKGYVVLDNLESISKVENGKLAGFTNNAHNPAFDERKNMLPLSTNTALNILDNNKKGFFLMVEGSQIDWAGHANNTDFLVGEMLDFDYTIGEVLKFAAEDKNTLVIVTADHETGGLAAAGGDYFKGTFKGAYTSKGHTGIMVPVFAWGPGSELFRGIMDNTEIHCKMKSLLSK